MQRSKTHDRSEDRSDHNSPHKSQLESHESMDNSQPGLHLTKDATTITDLCSNNDLPEVEIISLIEESIPKYTLRADSLTQFSGYEHEDWFVPHPALPSDLWDVQVTPQVARETLNYMVLSGKRVSQMTRTYNDIEAVTRLLEEKEKDLELTARIGQELLTHNNQLEAQVAALETQLKEEQERLVQTQHELAKKAELLAVLAAEDDSSDPTSPTGSTKSITLDILQRKVATLEVQNGQLKDEARQLATETTVCEEKERQLLRDIAQQLGMANEERSGLCDELSRLKEENRIQHEELLTRVSRLAHLEASNNELSQDNAFLTSQLTTTKHTQDLLCTEILDLKEQYAQVLGLLNEAQEQIRTYRKKHMPAARIGPTTLNPPLGMELETSLLSDSSLDSGVSVDKPVPSYRRVFETVRSASRGASSSGGGSSNPSPAHNMFGPVSSTLLTSASTNGPKMSTCFSSTGPSSWRPTQESIPSLSGVHSIDSSHSMSLSEELSFSGGGRMGSSGQPASLDLEVALGRISATEVLQRRQRMTCNDMDIDNYFCRTPDSIMSTGSSSGLSGGTWRLPEKLQIVKPMEGSLTLQQWSQLARPNLGSALAERPCVLARGQSSGSEDHTRYTLDDLEEDDWETSHPGKQFENSPHTFTFTNSTVLHPEDLTQVTSSYQGLQMSATMPMNDQQQQQQRSSPPPPATPCNRSRRNSTSTFSTSLGLAKMLNERGITAAASRSPSISACATPCNSPERPSSPQPSPRGFFAVGADILRRTLGTDIKDSSRKPKRKPESKAVSKIRLVDKIEEVGLDTILRPPMEARSIGPMSQLVGRGGRGRGRGQQQRRDLGTVQPRTSSNSSQSGTVSCLLFGRKGGLF